MLEILTERQKLLLGAALGYTAANLDDLNDVLAVHEDDDPDNEQGRIQIGAVILDSFTAKEIKELALLVSFSPPT